MGSNASKPMEIMLVKGDRPSHEYSAVPTEELSTTAIEDKCRFDSNNKLHSSDDMPAVVIINGSMTRREWYSHGKLNREDDKPAVVVVNGISTQREWYSLGELNRLDDKPAVIQDCIAGYLQKRYWFVDGKLCRLDDKPAIVTLWIRRRTTSEWYVNGLRHRSIGHAVIGRFCERWLDGQIHSHTEYFDANTWETLDADLEYKEKISAYTCTYHPNGTLKDYVCYTRPIAGCYKSDFWIARSRQYDVNGVLRLYIDGDRQYSRFSTMARSRTVNQLQHTFRYDAEGKLHTADGNFAYLCHWVCYTNNCCRFTRMISMTANHGMCHSFDDKPAIIVLDKLQKHVGFAWFTNGVANRDEIDQPTIVVCAGDSHQTLTASSCITYEEWHVNGRINRLGERPATRGKVNNEFITYLLSFAKISSPAPTLLKKLNFPPFSTGGRRE